jgi:hypothetical protein
VGDFTTATTRGDCRSLRWRAIASAHGRHVAADALPADVPAAGAVDVTAQVKAPAANADGNSHEDYTLRWELYNKASGKWLSETAPRSWRCRRPSPRRSPPPTSSAGSLSRSGDATGRNAVGETDRQVSLSRRG